jgi:hypothetical protein
MMTEEKKITRRSRADFGLKNGGVPAALAGAEVSIT